MKRRCDLDVTRVLCMCAVVYLHAAYPSFSNMANRPLWLFSGLINTFAALAVPLFFMMSGALLLSQSSTADPVFVLKRRVSKVLVPLLVWSAVMLCYTADRQGPDAALSALKAILNTPANVGYWFLYALIPMYLLSPLLKPLVDALDRRRWRYALLLWLVLTLGLSTLRELLPDAWDVVFTEHWTLNINAVGGYLGYFLLGAYLDSLEELPPRKVLVWGTALTAAATFGANCAASCLHGSYIAPFTGYLTVFTALRSAGVFLLMKSLFSGRETRRKGLKVLAGCSFCVYLAHPLVIFLGSRVWLRLVGTYDPGNIPQQIIHYLAVLGVCVLLAVVLSSIPVVCDLFTGQRFGAACKSSNLFALFAKGQGQDHS